MVVDATATALKAVKDFERDVAAGRVPYGLPPTEDGGEGGKCRVLFRIGLVHWVVLGPVVNAAAGGGRMADDLS